MSERDVGAVAGPKFTKGDSGVLFTFVIDPGNVIGPRPATAADQEQYAEAWGLFCRAEGIAPLDRDAKGGPGGSLAEPSRGGRRRRLKNESPDDHPGGM